MLFTLNRKAAFQGVSRYILFGHMLFADSIQLLCSMFSYLIAVVKVYMSNGLCVILLLPASITIRIAPLNLAVMALERYSAICFPLRHADIATCKWTGVAIGVVWVLGSLNALIRFFLFITIGPPFFVVQAYCRKGNLFNLKLYSDMNKAFTIVYFVSVSLIIVYTYVAIMLEAKSVSSDKSKATKARNTVLLHLIQLGLCLSSFAVGVLNALTSRLEGLTGSNVRHQRVCMAKNGTAQNGSIGSSPTSRQVTEKVLVVQVLVGIFLSVNCLMIFTFFKKEAFRNDVRYILFVHTLFCDSLFLFSTNILLLLSYFRVLMPVGLCLCFYVLVSILTFSTPLTLMAMSLERYVAICIPLRHAEISTPSKAIRCIHVIHALSSIQLIIITSVFISTVPLSFYMTDRICSVELFIVHKWQGYLRHSALNLTPPASPDNVLANMFAFSPSDLATRSPSTKTGTRLIPPHPLIFLTILHTSVMLVSLPKMEQNRRHAALLALLMVRLTTALSL
ncbi:hypothetical protein SKAU_G00040120 [Synaphobranchus kaupii]|uniref:G-protein coupled receptors family 1 profile domain-containing protein n=1 Tax=Synaphobranchus kaupii TaxID=118154 RepID=A0A9Q1JI73_SYNKA|nr:hypothetical protein SKAU_G00040120 [Synaphobranchus kaupii]